MKIFFIFTFLLGTFLYAGVQKPISKYIASGGVIDLIYKNSKLYAATNASSVDIFDVKSEKLLQSIRVGKIKDFMGDEIDSKIFSVDVLEDKILILSQGEHGFRRLHIYSNDKLELIIPVSKQMYISEAKFLDSHTILLALLGSDLISYDLASKKENWHIQASQSKFSDFILNENKTRVVLADESGDLKIFDTKSSKHIKTLSGENLDNVFKVDYKKDIIATAGKDRRVVIYKTKTGTAYYKMTNFLIYAVGLSPSGNLVAYASDENNNVTVFNTRSKKNISKFTGNKMTLTCIVFLSESEFVVASDDKVINRYKIKE